MNDLVVSPQFMAKDRCKIINKAFVLFYILRYSILNHEMTLFMKLCNYYYLAI